MPGQVIIKAEGLRKVYAGTEALSDLTFEVPEGEVFGFIGANGAGKTTTLRILAGLARPSAGWAEVDGVDVATERDQLHELVGYMPDFFGVYDSMTAAEYLAFYASCYRLPKHLTARVVTDLLELVHLGSKQEAQVNTLSRGMKQRLCLARALVHDPKVLLLDEPASGLDPRARGEMRELVQALREMGKTIVLSSHILPELAEMCTSYGIIHDGRMVAHGPAGAILGQAGPRRPERASRGTSRSPSGWPGASPASRPCGGPARTRSRSTSPAKPARPEMKRPTPPPCLEPWWRRASRSSTSGRTTVGWSSCSSS